ncbi:RES domain-containing protein [Cupriavidus necator]
MRRRCQRTTRDFTIAQSGFNSPRRRRHVHVDYLPSQVVTEFVRDYRFEGGVVDGIAYGSTVHRRGWNIALFPGPIDLCLAEPVWGENVVPSLAFERAMWATNV